MLIKKWLVYKGDELKVKGALWCAVLEKNVPSEMKQCRCELVPSELRRATVKNLFPSKQRRHCNLVLSESRGVTEKISAL